MPTLVERKMTLREMREAMNDGKGMSRREVAERVAKLLSEKERTGESIAMIERRGIEKYHVIKALAAVYNREYDEIAEAAKPLGKL